MRKLLPLAGLLFLFALPADARNREYPLIEVFTGYSYLRPDLLLRHDQAHGFEISVTGNAHKNVGIEAEFSEHFGTLSNTSVTAFGFTNLTQIDYSNRLFLFGPRVAARTHRFTPWGHGLIGVAQSRALEVSDDNFAFAVGGGLDANVLKNFAIRVIQADYVFVKVQGFGFDANSHNLRLSTGVVFKFGKSSN